MMDLILVGLLHAVETHCPGSSCFLASLQVRPVQVNTGEHPIPTMKAILPWLVAVLALGSTWFFYNSGKTKSAEITELKTQVAELDNLRAKNEELKQNYVSPAEVERLRKDSQDALRLRNEIGQLRNQKAEVEQQAQRAQAEAERAQAQIQATRSQVQALAQQQAQANAAAQQAATARYGLAQTDPTNACIKNLRQIDGAKQQWALENRKTTADTPTAEQIAPYLSGEIPVCPAGGAYSLNAVGELATCNQPGHALPE